jgi:hypothetical protein
VIEITKFGKHHKKIIIIILFAIVIELLTNYEHIGFETKHLTQCTDEHCQECAQLRTVMQSMIFDMPIIIVFSMVLTAIIKNVECFRNIKRYTLVDYKVRLNN